MLAILKWLLIGLLTLLLAGFAVVNRHWVSIQFYPLPFELEIPVYLLIVALFFAGFLAAWLLARLHALRLRLKLHRQQARCEALEEEVARLRHQPALPVEPH